MSKLYFYKCAHSFLFWSLFTIKIHLQFYTKILTLNRLIPTHSSMHSHPVSQHSHHSHPDSPHSLHSHPDSHHSQPDSVHSLHFHPYAHYFHPDSLHSHHSQSASPHSPHFQPDSLLSHHSLHSVPRFPIPAFTDSQFRFCEALKVTNFVTRILLIETLSNFRTIKCCFALYLHMYHVCFGLVSTEMFSISHLAFLRFTFH